MTVHVTGDADDELTTESEMRDVQPVSSGKRHSRINSIGKLLKTPLVSLRFYSSLVLKWIHLLARFYHLGRTTELLFLFY